MKILKQTSNKSRIKKFSTYDRDIETKLHHKSRTICICNFNFFLILIANYITHNKKNEFGAFKSVSDIEFEIKN